MSEAHVVGEFTGLKPDLDKIKDALPTQFASSSVWDAMEYVLDRLDGTYGMTDDDGNEVKPEDMHRRRVQIMCGIIKTALDLGYTSGLNTAETRIHNMIHGIKER